MPNDAYTTLFNLEFFQNSVALVFVVKAVERPWSFEKGQNNEVLSKLGWVRLFLQTIQCKIFWEKLRNQIKSDKVENYNISFYLFLSASTKNFKTGH